MKIPKAVRGSIKARVVPVNRLDLASRVQMYRIFQNYYDGVAWEQFQHDLMEKNDVILLDHLVDGIVGFSTLLWKPIEVDGRQVIGVFSGDTILEQNYWGSPALGIKFLSYLWTLKLKHFGTPVYWFLISKGYKTYLLMSNNFRDSFPHFRRKTPTFEKELMNRFYGEKFAGHYRPEKGIIAFSGGPTCKLKGQIAPITDSLKHTVPSVGFFEHVNPGWKSGDELACIARMTLDMPVRYAFKKLVIEKLLKRRGSTSKLALNGNRRVSPVRLGPEFRRDSYAE